MERRRTRLRTTPSDTTSARVCRAAHQGCAALFFGSRSVCGQLMNESDSDTGKGRTPEPVSGPSKGPPWVVCGSSLCELRSMRNYYLLAVVVAMPCVATVPSAAQACRIGQDTVIFEERPAPIGLDDFEIIEARFRNHGPEVEQFQRELPHLVDDDAHFSGPSLIGAAFPSDASEAIPVYATVTSCTGFFDRQPLDTEAYFFGRWTVLPDGRKAFVAGGNWNGRWHF